MADKQDSKLDRRTIPRNERTVKAGIVLLVTAVIVSLLAKDVSPGSAWYLWASLALIAVAGLSVAVWIYLKTEEIARGHSDNYRIQKKIEEDSRGFDFVDRWIYIATIVVGILVLLAGIGIMILQIYWFLDSGEWIPLPLLVWIEPFVPWLQDPDSWIGLHKIVHGVLAFVPTSLAIIVLGFGIMSAGESNKEDKIARYEAWRRGRGGW